MFEAIKQFIYNRRVDKEIKRADEMHSKTGRKYMVMNLNGRPVTLSKQQVKHMIKSHRLRTTIGKMEEIAIYETK
ncbi:MAG TPA: hypothetical protein PLN63_06715 [Paludibacteraceae bacterium]|nr:hypothetical protein [Paludibacteraceae bacterium]HOU68038.1 hypothetical protein [Paludibacteraceae bacterium]HPH63293.1 hypothetical protein [Paludibacteraceae bacterium]HQF49963.1 hypothetical protein [Paludibacteraceae bacterium]